MKATLRDGNVISTGHMVLFAQGFEQRGKVIGITETACGEILTLVPMGDLPFEGDVIGGDQEASAFADCCWIE